MPITPTPQRKLHIGHFAFMRAVVQGIGTRPAWTRYLHIEGEYTDLRAVCRTIAWLRHQFAAAAQRHQRHGIARLLQIDLDTIAEEAPAAPSPENFIAERGMKDFRESEQLEAYHDENGNASVQQSRRGRLIAKQLAALFWLESLVAEPPRADHAVGDWLQPELAIRLVGAGVTTLAQLVERINGIGRHWWRGIPVIGAGKAARIVEWVRAHEASIGMAIGAHAALPRTALHSADLANLVPHATAVVPFEKLIVPTELNGANGLYRLPQHLCLIRATNDYAAILAWIHCKRGITAEARAARHRRRGIDLGSSTRPAAPAGPFEWRRDLSHTQRAYLMEAERYLLWAVVERRKPLSSMTLEDCTAYRDFLADPQPAQRWCGTRGRELWGPLWRPFAGPLSVTAQRRTIAALKSFYRWLVDQCYLRGNPWGGITAPHATRPALDVGRSFTQSQWDFIEDFAAGLQHTSANRRLRLALHLLYATGLRLSEVVAVRVRDLSWKSYPADRLNAAPIAGWELTVLGKGGKLRSVPLPQDVADELGAYLASRGLPADLHATPPDAYLLGRATDVAMRAKWSPAAKSPVDPLAGIGAQTLVDAMKGFFARCAAALEVTDGEGTQRLGKASIHWLRHTHGSHANAAGVDLKVLQQNMGHASIGTTTRYTTSEGRRQMQEMAKLGDARRRALPESTVTPPPEPVAPLRPVPARTGMRLAASDGVAVGTVVAELTLRLSIENNSRHGRGKTRVRDDIERGCLNQYLVRKIDAHHYALAIPYDGDEDLHWLIDDLLVKIHRTAYDRHCEVEADLYEDDTERTWS
jgi:site-specific recombinase XerD